MSRFKFKLLPHWHMTDDKPAFYDLESKTAVGMTARLYATMQKLIETHNEWVDSYNLYLAEYQDNMSSDYECFKANIEKICHDYIQTMDMKIECQDRQIAEIEEYLKTNLKGSLQAVVDEMRESGELNEVILETFDNLNTKITELETNINNQITSLSNRISVIENTSYSFVYDSETENITFNKVIGG